MISKKGERSVLLPILGFFISLNPFAKDHETQKAFLDDILLLSPKVFYHYGLLKVVGSTYWFSNYILG
jgi:hypothetical protein